MPNAKPSLGTPWKGRSLSFGLALALVGCGGGGPAWKTIHDQTAGFSAEFPGDVAQPQGVEKSGTGGPQIYHFECRPPNGFTYEITFIAQPNTDEQIGSRLDKAEGETWRPNDPKVTRATKRIPLGTLAGIEQLGRLNDGSHKEFKRWRIFYTPTGDYYLSVDSVTSSDADAPEVERFLNSFKIDSLK